MRKPSKIGIAGAGGIGSHLVELLFDFGVNKGQYDYSEMDIRLFDDDTVDQKNLLHQNFRPDDLGKHKAKVLEDKYAVTAVTRFMTVEDFPKFDVIFSCVDGMEFRRQLYEYKWQNPNGKLFWVDGRCTSRFMTVLNSEVDRPTLERTVDNSTERGGCLLQYEKENNISHATPKIVAAIMMQTFLNYLRGDKTYLNERMI